MDALQESPENRAALTAKLIDAARKDIYLHANVGKDVRAGDDAGKRSDVQADVPVPTPPFWGAKVVRDIPLGEVMKWLDLDELYRLQWGGRGSGPEYKAAVKNEFEPTLKRLTASAEKEGWIKPEAIYGYFPVNSDRNDVIVFDPKAYALNGEKKEITRFSFPRQEGRDRLCLADYFRDISSDTVDVAAFQIVTVGEEATKRFERLQGAGEYTEAFYSHGLSVEAAEAVASWMHARVRQELGIPEERGKRYSWGYGACPDLDDHAKLFEILPAHQELGMDLTSAFQLMPEQSTAAIVVHHPEAKYYVVREDAAAAGRA
jgi:5-methyltetrahydrofolate--homocysteine methyltransferase